MEINENFLKGIEGQLQNKTLLSQPISPTQEKGFGDLLNYFIQEASGNQKNAESFNRRFVNVDMGKIHENTIALEQANISLKMLVTMRNKLLEAYKELMHLNG